MENTEFLKTYLTKKLDFSEQTAEQALVPFLRQKDILDELCKTLEKGEFPQEMICEQGFTARSFISQRDMIKLNNGNILSPLSSLCRGINIARR